MKLFKKINKKGFTLIELLAVIIVLGLVLSVSTYFIVDAIKSSKEKAMVLSENSVKESARIYSVEDPNLGWKQRSGDTDNTYFCTTVYELKNKGFVPKNASNIDSFNNKYIIMRKNDATKVIEEVSIINSDDLNGEFCKINFGKYIIAYYNGDDYLTEQEAYIFETITLNNGENYKDLKQNNILSSWNTKKDGTGTNHNLGEAYTQGEAEDVKLYAKWTPSTYNLTYNYNGGTAKNGGCTLVTNKELNSNWGTLCDGSTKASKVGYSFDGWYTAATGGTEITANTIVTEDIIAYAHWKPNVLKIIYKVNNGETLNDRWHTDTSGYIYDSQNAQVLNTIEYGGSLEENGLTDCNNSGWLNISKTGYSAVSEAEWKCSGCSQEGKTFNQRTNYSASDFADLSNGDKTVILSVNWKKDDDVINDYRFDCRKNYWINDDKYRTPVYYVTTCPNDSICNVSKHDGFSVDWTHERSSLRIFSSNDIKSCKFTYCATEDIYCRERPDNNSKSIVEFNFQSTFNNLLRIDKKVDNTSANWYYYNQYNCYINGLYLASDCSYQSTNNPACDTVCHKCNFNSDCNCGGSANLFCYKKGNSEGICSIQNGAGNIMDMCI